MDGLDGCQHDVTRPPAQAVREAVRGVDAVVHLGGISLEDTFEAVLQANIQGTYHLYEAVRREGVRRVVFAGSNHAVGYVPLTAGAPIGSAVPARPDTYYGLSKAFGENPASLYADKYGVETGLSPADCARLAHAALTAPGVGHTVVNGISANTRAWWDLTSARALGYAPQGDAEAYAEAVLAEHGPLDPAHPDARWVGGSSTPADPHRPTPGG
ncbi:NAD-dependent epimerase/dehydratase family protein [Streptomyces sp. NPDC048340]|uniref:NAD-dependent epimerase/dehydratase family protein n=1 Tax=Streptomyces sp. NPDC048340 TaxID=3365537 RepID=UPI003719E9D9